MNKTLKKVFGIRPIIQVIGIILAILGIIGGSNVLKVVFVALNVIMGPIFCGWICPFGSMQDAMSFIGKKLNIKKKRMPKLVHQTLLPLRYILLVAVALIGLDFIFTLLSYDPRSNILLFLTGNTIAIIGWLVIGVFLLISVFFDRPFCQYGCVEGARNGLLSTIRPVTIQRDSDKCVDCGKCNRVCPMQIDVAHHDSVRSLQCINCMSCITSCPIEQTLTINVQSPNKIGWSPQKALILILALSFFGIAGYNQFIDSQTTDSASFVISSELKGAASGVSDGIYEGVGSGFKGDMTVSVTVTNEQITAIDIVEHQDDKDWFDRAYDQIVSEIITDQDTEVDNVSGATYSSMGIKSAVADAMINAGSTTVSEIETTEPSHSHGGHKQDNQHVDESSVDVSEEVIEDNSSTVSDTDTDLNLNSYAVGIADGTYEGVGSGFKGDLTVVVTVQAEQITSVEVISSNDDKSWLDNAIDNVIPSIIEQQTAEVDNVSGATYSSMGIKSAVADALIKAGSTTVSEIETTEPSYSHGGPKEDEPSVDEPSAEVSEDNSSTVSNTDFNGYAVGVADGTYEGVGSGFKGELTVEVTVQAEQITSVEVISSSDDKSWLDNAIESVIPWIIEQQTAEVDNVSGATYSSMGIKQAVADAMINAGSTNATAIENASPSRNRRKH